jgi:hypothetical protein
MDSLQSEASVILSEAKDLVRSRRREQILRAFGPQNDRDGEALRMTGTEETRGVPAGYARADIGFAFQCSPDSLGDGLRADS